MDSNIGTGINTGNPYNPNLDDLNQIDPTIPETETDGDPTTSTITKSKAIAEQKYASLRANAPVLQSPSTDPKCDPHSAMAQVSRIMNNPALASQVMSTLQKSAEEWDPGIEDDTVPLTQTLSEDPAIIQAAKAQGIPVSDFVKQIIASGNIELAQALVGSGIPPNQMEAAKFMIEYPQTATHLDPAVKKILKQVMAKVDSQLAQQFKLGSGFKGVFTTASPSSQAAFDNGCLLDFDNAFLQEILDQGVTPEQRGLLLTAHFTGVAPQDPALKAIFDAATKVASDKVDEKFGYVPTPSSQTYQDVLNAAFLEAFDETLTAYSSQMQVLLQQYTEAYMANPNDPTIPANVKDILAQIVNSSNAAVAKEFGLPSDWKTTLTSLNPLSLDPAKLLLAKEGIKMVTDMYKELTAQAGGLPDSPEKSVWINYLKLIGQKINDAINEAYAMQASDSSIGNQLSSLKLNMQLDDIAQQKTAGSSVKKDQGKMSKLPHWVKSCIDVVGKIFSVIGGLLGPLGLPIALLKIACPALVDKIVKGLTDAVNKLMKSLRNYLPNWAVAVTQAILTVAVTFVACVVAGPIVGLSLMTQQGGLIEASLLRDGASKEGAAIGCAVIGGVSQLVVGIAMTFLAGPAGIAELLGTITEAAASVATSMVQVLLKSLVIVADDIANLAKAIMVTFTVATTALTITNGVVTSVNDVELADIVMIKARMEATSEKLQAIIQSIIQLITQIMDLVSGSIADMITDLTAFQGKKWDDALTHDGLQG